VHSIRKHTKISRTERSKQVADTSLPREVEELTGRHLNFVAEVK